MTLSSHDGKKKTRCHNDSGFILWFEVCSLKLALFLRLNLFVLCIFFVVILPTDNPHTQRGD